MVSGVSYIYLSLVNMLYQPTMKTARYSKQHSKTFIAIQYIILASICQFGRSVTIGIYCVQIITLALRTGIRYFVTWL